MKTFTIKFYSSYAVWNHQEWSCIAENESDALNNFWEGRNKESFEIISIKHTPTNPTGLAIDKTSDLINKT